MKRLIATLIMAPASAGAFSLELPIDCDLGETCYIQQYVDRDAGPNAADFTCGTLSYDEHSGTDFALPTLADMAKGVVVRAAADGVVKGTRDGMDDISAAAPNAPDIAGKECGNGVLVDHGDGWETQYCHMAKGSLRVATGDAVVAGQMLGLVGISGQAEFPHLHLSVRKSGAMIDPFDPDGAATCGVGPDAPLWASDVPYAAGGIVTLGLSSSVPEWDAIRAGLPTESLGPAAPALVIWAHYFGNQAGDTLRLSITAPDGSIVIADDVALDRTQALAFRAIGKKMPQGGWAKGDYRLDATLIRTGQVVDEQSTTVTLN